MAVLAGAVAKLLAAHSHLDLLYTWALVLLSMSIASFWAWKVTATEL